MREVIHKRRQGRQGTGVLPGLPEKARSKVPLADSVMQKPKEKIIVVVMHGSYIYSYGIETLSQVGKQQIRKCGALLKCRVAGKCIAIYTASIPVARESAAMLRGILGSGGVEERQELTNGRDLCPLMSDVTKKDTAEVIVLVTDSHVAHTLGGILGKKSVHLQFGGCLTVVL